MEEALRQAGFREVGSQAIPAPLCMAHTKDYVRSARESFGALHQMLAWQEISTELARFEGPAGFEGPCELIVAWGVK